MIRLVLGMCLLPSALTLAQDQRLGKLFSEAYEERLRERPELATAAGRHDYDDRWTDWSAAARARRADRTAARLKELDRFPLAALSQQDRLSARLLRTELEQERDNESIDTSLLRVNQLFGLHNLVYVVTDRMPARTQRDYANIIARLRAAPAYVEQNIAVLEEAIGRGLVQPRVVAEIVVKQLAAQAAQDARKSALLAAFRRFPSNIPQSERDALWARAVDAYEREFLPAWRKLLQYFSGTYLKKARETTGLGAIPGGAKAYELLVRRATTTRMSPDEIHRLGEREVRRIEDEMQALMREAGFSGTLDEFQRKLEASPEQHFRTKDEMLAYCRNAAKVIEPELPRLFKRIPLLLYGIRAIPEDREQATASNAQPPAPDGSSPGWFNLNAYNPEKQVRYDKEALVLHEAVPGHVFQLALARSLQGLPDFRKDYQSGAYVEGWALYAESLGAELGVYRDPYSRFGRLASERFRAARLVVDTGLHAKGWTRDQAIDYFHKHAPNASLSEIDRYIAWPAQALQYKVGELKIRELRRAAEEALGAKFDVREFHDVLLRNGALPLDVLEELVKEYIAGAR